VGSVWNLVLGKKNEEKNVREEVKRASAKRTFRHLSHSYSLGEHYFNRLGVFLVNLSLIKVSSSQLDFIWCC